ncbi:unnamed protein product, partial [Urochloa humidicola]
TARSAAAAASSPCLRLRRIHHLHCLPLPNPRSWQRERGRGLRRWSGYAGLHPRNPNPRPSTSTSRTPTSGASSRGASFRAPPAPPPPAPPPRRSLMKSGRRRRSGSPAQERTTSLRCGILSRCRGGPAAALGSTHATAVRTTAVIRSAPHLHPCYGGDPLCTPSLASGFRRLLTTLSLAIVCYFFPLRSICSVHVALPDAFPPKVEFLGLFWRLIFPSLHSRGEALWCPCFFIFLLRS